MSRSALALLAGALAFLLAAAAVPYTQSPVATMLLGFSLVCALLFVVALVRGKRIRFNPQLR